MIPRDLIYGFPHGVFLLFLVLVFSIAFVSLYYFRQRVRKAWTQMPLPQTGNPRSMLLFSISSFCLLLSSVCAILAWMQPMGNGRYPYAQEKDGKDREQLQRKAHDVVFLVDTSASMEVKDTRTGVSRLDFAKEIADEIASKMNGQSLTLYAMTEKTTKVVPPTYDYLFFRLMLRQLGINEGDIAGTNFLNAIQHIHDSFLSSGAEPALKTVIILSDGGDTIYESDPSQERSTRLSSIVQAMGNPIEEHLRVFTIGLGSLSGGIIPNVKDKGKSVTSVLIPTILKSLSLEGRGEYYEANAYSALDIAHDIQLKIAKDNPYYRDVPVPKGVNLNQMVYDHYFQWPLGLALFFLAIALLLPQSFMRMLLLLFLLMPTFSNAATVADASDPVFREIQVAYESGHFESALSLIEGELAKNPPLWKQNILYYNQGLIWIGLKEYQKGIAALTQLQDPDPALKLRATWNVVMAKYELAAQALDRLSTADAPKLRDFFNATILLREARYEGVRLQKTICDLEHKGGVEECLPSDTLVLMDQACEEKLWDVGLATAEYYVHRASAAEILPALEYSIFQTSYELRFLETIQHNPDLMAHYIQFIANEMQTWIILWEALKGRIPSKGAEAVQAAFTHYRNAIQQLRENNQQEARLSLEESGRMLTAIQQEASHQPLTLALTRLLYQYRVALSGYPLQEIEIQGLISQQKRLKETQEKHSMQQSLELLNMSLNALHQDDPLRAKFFIQGAMFNVRFLLLEQAPLSEEELLDELIGLQSQLVFLTRLMGEQDLLHTEDVVSLLAGETNKMGDGVKLLWDRILKGQREGFKKECQAAPWGEVMPLLDRASRDLKSAVELLAKKEPQMRTAETLQEYALEQLRQAQAKWHSKGSGGGCTGQELTIEKKEKGKEKEKPAPQPTPSDQNEKQQPKESEKEEKKGGEQQGNTSNFLRLLQELEQDDRQQSKKREPIPMQGTKPW